MSKSIHSLTELLTPASSDYLPIFDGFSNSTKKVSIQNLLATAPEPKLTRTSYTLLTFNSLSNLQTEDIYLQLGQTFTLLSVDCNAKCRLRLYASTTHRDADRARDINTDPTGNHGLLLELILNSYLSINLAPIVTGYTLDPSTCGIIQSYSQIATKLSCVFTYLKLEP